MRQPRDPTAELARAVLMHGPISRAELGEMLGLSLPSLSRLGKPLLEAGILVQAPQQSSGVGRPVRYLDVRADAEQIIGIKVTATEATGVRTDMRARVAESAVRRLSGTQVAQVVDTIDELVAELTPAGQSMSHVGVSLGGEVDANGTVLRAPFLGWQKVNFAHELAQALGVPVAVENDLVALAVAEQWFGLGKERDNFAVITVGAGVGYALVINDSVVAPPDAGLGLIGHLPLIPDGPLCSLGHRGCASAVLSSGGMCRYLEQLTGRTATYPELLDLAHGGDKSAVAVIQLAARALGQLIANAANLTMVNDVVVSGEGSDFIGLVRATVDASLAAGRDPLAQQVRWKVRETGFCEWAQGAAAVAVQRHVSMGVGLLHEQSL